MNHWIKERQRKTSKLLYGTLSIYNPQTTVTIETEPVALANNTKLAWQSNIISDVRVIGYKIYLGIDMKLVFQSKLLPLWLVKPGDTFTLTLGPGNDKLKDYMP